MHQAHKLTHEAKARALYTFVDAFKSDATGDAAAVAAPSFGAFAAAPRQVPASAINLTNPLHATSAFLARMYTPTELNRFVTHSRGAEEATPFDWIDIDFVAFAQSAALEFPGLKCAFEAAMCVPASEAVSEGDFAHAKYVRNAWRMSMSIPKLESYMRVRCAQRHRRVKKGRPTTSAST